MGRRSVWDRAVGPLQFIARPGLIVGPGDPSDRFSYWVSRLALASTEPVLVPEVYERAAQFIDVRDLAQWLIDAGHRGLTGIYNAVGSEHGFARRSRSRFLAAGGTERNMRQTLEDVLSDEQTRGLDRNRRSGLTREEEILLLDEMSG